MTIKSLENFDKRLNALHKERNTPPEEIDAAVVTMERLRTAMAICRQATGDDIDTALLAAVLTELGEEARSGQGTKLRP